MGNLPVPIEDVDYYIGEIELDWTDQPFDRVIWLRDELRKLKLDADGNPLRLGLIERPKNESKLDSFGVET